MKKTELGNKTSKKREKTELGKNGKNGNGCFKNGIFKFLKRKFPPPANGHVWTLLWT